MKWMKFTIKTTTLAVDLVSDMLGEIGIEGMEIDDNVPLTKEEEALMYTDIPAELPEDDGIAYVHFYIDPDSHVLPIENEDGEQILFSTGSSLRDEEKNAKMGEYLFHTKEELIARIEEGLDELRFFMDIGEGSISISFTEDTDWLNNWKTFFKPIAIADDIIVKPTWESLDEADEDKIIVEIDPGTAFGTGTHETTKLMVLALRKYLEDGMDILDAGCGSGILSIIASKLGAHFTYGLDIDPAAVSATLENATINGLGTDVLQASLGNILDESSLPDILKGDTSMQFDIVVANILADVIVALTPNIAQYIKKRRFLPSFWNLSL